MQMEPGYSFREEFPKIDKALKLIGPFAAAIVSFLIILFLQGILPIHLIFVSVLTLAQADPSYAVYIFPGVAAIYTLYRDHESKKSHNTRLKSTNRSNVPFFEDPNQPAPDYRPRHKEQDEVPPRDPDA